MTLDEALEILGLDRTCDRDGLRTRYRDAMQSAHPDVAGGDEVRARQITGAHRLVRSHLEPDGSLPPAPAAAPTNAAAVAGSPIRTASATTSPTSSPAGASPPQHGPLDDEDALTIIAPAEDVFIALYDAMQRVGDVTYVDRDAGMLEALVAISNQPPSQLLVTLQGRAHGTEAMFTLTANGNETPPPIAAVVEVVADQLRRPSSA